MEVNCPSCGSQHRSEDYPGAFDILCGCGYLILNPDIGEESAGGDYNEINFEGPPAVAETQAKDLIRLHQEDALNLSIAATDDLEFSAESLTPPEELPEGMLYDPAEVPGQDEPPEKLKRDDSTFSRIFVEKIQKASIGQILGADYDLEFSELDPSSRMKSRERIERFLQDHKWLREEMERRSFVIAELFQHEKASGIPEALAVEMYIACLENGGKCIFIRHALSMTG